MSDLKKFSIALTDRELEMIENKRIELESKIGVRVSRNAMIRRILGFWMRRIMLEERFPVEMIFSDDSHIKNEEILSSKI